MPKKPVFFDARGVRVLIATDNDVEYSVLDQQLTPEGYHLTRCKSSQEVLDLIQNKPFPIILAEQDLQEMPGMDLFNRIRESHADTARILISQSLPPRALMEAVTSGTLSRFLKKPWLRYELLITLRTATLYNRLITQNRSLHEKNIQLNLQLKLAVPTEAATDVPSSPEPSRLEGTDEPGSLFIPSYGGPAIEIPPAVDLAIRAFTRMLYTFHPNLGNTSIRTKALCQGLCKVLDLSPEDSSSLIYAAALHDVGMVQIDRDLVRRWIRRPENCEDKELAILQMHPENTQRVLEDFQVFEPAGEIIHSHHECWDGSGYPDGLKEDEIPWLSRLLCVAISYCSKHAPSIIAMGEIEEEAETKFDPDAIPAVSKAAAMVELPRGEREVLLIELRKGMILAEDIFNAYGFLLLPQGTEMTDTLISKIWAANRVAPLDPYILVLS